MGLISGVAATVARWIALPADHAAALFVVRVCAAGVGRPLRLRPVTGRDAWMCAAAEAGRLKRPMGRPRRTLGTHAPGGESAVMTSAAAVASSASRRWLQRSSISCQICGPFGTPMKWALL